MKARNTINQVLEEIQIEHAALEKSMLIPCTSHHYHWARIEIRQGLKAQSKTS